MKKLFVSVKRLAKNLFRLEILFEKEQENQKLKEQLESLQKRGYDILIASAAYVMKLNRQHQERVAELKAEVQSLREENLELRDRISSLCWAGIENEAV